MNKNDLIDIEITGITSDGSGIGRFNSMVVFVPNTAIGDNVRVRVLKVKKNYAYGKLEEVLFLSESRAEVDCQTYFQCGGCCFRHISYESELKVKEKIVYDCIQKISKIDENNLKKIFSPIIKSNNIYNYRNKTQVPVCTSRNNNIISGFFSLHSHRIVSSKQCKLQPSVFDEIISEIKLWASDYNICAYDEKTNSGYLRHIYLRIGEVTNEIMVCLVVNSSKTKESDSLIKKLTSKFPSIRSIIFNFNQERTNVILGSKYETVWGRDHIVDILCGLKFKISPKAFYQINHDQTEKLYSKIRDLLVPTNGDNILDLFCGIGTIGLTLASSCNKLLGIEIIPEAVENARQNAKVNNICNSKFICADANNILDSLADNNFKASAVIIDPPRKGCSQSLIKTINNINPSRVIYVSCNPSTLARDIKIFLDYGFFCIKIIPIDMFPRTKHVETVTLLARKVVDNNEIEYMHVDYEPEDAEYLRGIKGSATYAEIKKWIKEQYNVSVSSLYIAQCKDECGFEKRDNYNKGAEGHKVPNCPAEKQELIMKAFEHFKMI